jgi:hypothetical protein
MYMPWPVGPVIDYCRRKRTLVSALREASSCSDAMGPVKYALRSAIPFRQTWLGEQYP